MKENLYFFYRIIKGCLYKLLFWIFRIFPVKNNKIVVCCFWGEMGYGCSAKYIVEALQKKAPERYEIVWLVKDTNKIFPTYVKPIKYNWISNAYHLSTAKIWIDNEKKGLGVCKRKGQIYINTWHGPIGFKTVGALRGGKWSKVGRAVSQNDCDLTDVYLSNSTWCTDIHTAAYPYKREIVWEVGTPRTDPLLNKGKTYSTKVRADYHLPLSSKILVYAPTFRGGIQKTQLEFQYKEISMDINAVLKSLESRFGGPWYVMIRLHPMVAAYLEKCPDLITSDRVIDISKVDDLYEILAASDALITDFSSCAFDACYKRIPIFLYVDDYDQYVSARDLYWKIEEIPFPIAKDNEELINIIEDFEDEKYQQDLTEFFKHVELKETGHASEDVAQMIEGYVNGQC